MEESSTPSATSGETGSSNEAQESCVNATSSSSGCRFSKEARSVLRTWYHEHKDNPYPTSEEKDELVARTQLKRSQISLWLANTRRKQRARANQKEMITPPSTQTFETMGPMDRWKVTPIEYEAVSPPVILAACEDNPLLPLDSIEEEFNHPSSLFEAEQSTANFSQYDAYWAQSMASYETGLTSLLGGSSLSGNTSFSYGSHDPSLHSQLTSRDRRRRRVHPSNPAKPTAKSKPRPFQCTFCPNCTFATKHDWQRHEKSQHLSLEKWICCANGGTFQTPAGPVCAFCDEMNPDTKHLERHNYSACQVKEADERTFYRKDHFQQHLRLTHEAKINPRMEEWKSEVTDVKSRCGFCSANFTSWSARADHLASHFKCRATMSDWVGDGGFELHIAMLIERALPSMVGLNMNPMMHGHELGNPKMPAFAASQPPPNEPMLPLVGFDDGQARFGQLTDQMYSFDPTTGMLFTTGLPDPNLFTMDNSVTMNYGTATMDWASFGM
jgi:hypothetical protein